MSELTLTQLLIALFIGQVATGYVLASVAHWLFSDRPMGRLRREPVVRLPNTRGDADEF